MSTELHTAQHSLLSGECRNKSALFKLTDEAIVNESAGIGIFFLCKLLSHKIEQSLKRNHDKIWNGRQFGLSQILKLFRPGPPPGPPILSPKTDRKIPVLAGCA